MSQPTSGKMEDPETYRRVDKARTCPKCKTVGANIERETMRQILYPKLGDDLGLTGQMHTCFLLGVCPSCEHQWRII